MSNQDLITRKDIEAWLQEILVPVEPDERFVRRLRGRLVRVQGGRMSTAWAIIGGVAIATVVLMTMFGLALRLFLSLLSVVGLLERRPPQNAGKQASTA